MCLMCKSVLDLTNSALRMYFGGSHIHVTAVTIFKIRCYFTPKLLWILMLLISVTFHVQLVVKCIFQWLLIWKFTSSNHQAKILITALKSASVDKVLFSTPSSRSLVLHLFCFASLTLLQCNVHVRNIYHLHITYWVLLKFCKFLASLSRLDIINLLLSMKHS